MAVSSDDVFFTSYSYTVGVPAIAVITPSVYVNAPSASKSKKVSSLYASISCLTWEYSSRSYVTCHIFYILKKRGR
jgi:hypothetical protein